MSIVKAHSGKSASAYPPFMSTVKASNCLAPTSSVAFRNPNLSSPYNSGGSAFVRKLADAPVTTVTVCPSSRRCRTICNPMHNVPSSHSCSSWYWALHQSNRQTPWCIGLALQSTTHGLQRCTRPRFVWHGLTLLTETSLLSTGPALIPTRSQTLAITFKNAKHTEFAQGKCKRAVAPNLGCSSHMAQTVRRAIVCDPQWSAGTHI